LLYSIGLFNVLPKDFSAVAFFGTVALCFGQELEEFFSGSVEAELVHQIYDSRGVTKHLDRLDARQV
jgi:hypothetical protein